MIKDVLRKPHIYVLTGPTAVGKTAVSIALAKRMGAEILSADSIQIYKGLDIGAAKPSLEERQGIPHHFLDITEVSDTTFSVAMYKRLVDACIRDLFKRGIPPLVVGGTGLYVHALTSPLEFTKVPGDACIRQQLMQEEAEAPGCLYTELQRVDPISAARLHPNDKKRIVRAVEVYRVSGQPLTSFGNDFINAQGQELPYNITIAGLYMEREALYARIEARVDAMMENGLLEETRMLYEKGYSHELPALQGLGYKQLLRYYNKEISLQEAVEDIKKETRHFAKRQWTWFKRDKRIRWFDIAPDADIDAITENIYKYFHQDDGEGVSHA